MLAIKPSKILIAAFFVLLLWYISLSYVWAREQNTIHISENYQTFIDFSKNQWFASLYYSGDIDISISPSLSAEIINKGSKLLIWIKPWVQKSLASLSLKYRGKTYIYPLEILLEKNNLDFSIKDDMYELSLQEKSLSCESAAAADIIESFYGKNLHEDAVISILPKSSHYAAVIQEHPWDINIWGNPELWFVWHIDHWDDNLAKQRLKTWYGVYEPPISDVFQDYWLQTEIFNITHHNDSITPELHLTYILHKLRSGSMVQLWGDWCTKLEYDDGVLENKREIKSIDIWDFISAKNTCYNVDEPRKLYWKYYNNYWELVDHTWLDGEHAFILLWWKGEITNPSHIRVWDTDTGYHLYPTTEWMRKWRAMDYRSIIVSK